MLRETRPVLEFRAFHVSKRRANDNDVIFRRRRDACLEIRPLVLLDVCTIRREVHHKREIIPAAWLRYKLFGGACMSHIKSILFRFVVFAILTAMAAPGARPFPSEVKAPRRAPMGEELQEKEAPRRAPMGEELQEKEAPRRAPLGEELQE